MERFIMGDVVQILKDNSRGIVVGQSPETVSVLFDSYMTIPIRKAKVAKIGRHVDLSKIWDSVYR